MWALFTAGFRLQASFRLAMVSGLATNTFFGLVRTAVFLAVYRARDDVAGLDLADAITYVWILQAVFAVMWSPWMQELPTRIRSGEWTAELTRPGPLLARHLVHDLGRSAAIIVLRAPFPIAFAAVAFELRLPTTPDGIALLAVSIALTAVAAASIRFLIGSIAFWTPDFRGYYSMLFGPLWLLGGFVIPIEYFPGVLAEIAAAGPLGALLRAPVAVATGRAVVEALALQAFWCVALVVVCKTVLDRATERLVVFGG